MIKTIKMIDEVLAVAAAAAGWVWRYECHHSSRFMVTQQLGLDHFHIRLCGAGPICTRSALAAPLHGGRGLLANMLRTGERGSARYSIFFPCHIRTKSNAFVTPVIVASPYALFFPRLIAFKLDYNDFNSRIISGVYGYIFFCCIFLSYKSMRIYKCAAECHSRWHGWQQMANCNLALTNK